MSVERALPNCDGKGLYQSDLVVGMFLFCQIKMRIFLFAFIAIYIIEKILKAIYTEVNGCSIFFQFLCRTNSRKNDVKIVVLVYKAKITQPPCLATLR